MIGCQLPIFNLHIYFFDIVQGVTNKSFSCDEEGHIIYYNVMQHIPQISQRILLYILILYYCLIAAIMIQVLIDFFHILSFHCTILLLLTSCLFTVLVHYTP